MPSTERAPERKRAQVTDVVIVGGGPAGLSAAMLLGRSRRKVLLFDSGKPRNAASRSLHGYLTRDGIRPAEWLRLARKEVDTYGVQRIDDEVVEVEPLMASFRVRTAGGRTVKARKVLMATGVCDTMPDVPGLAPLYGTSVFHCPYCDGWEVRDRPLAALGRRSTAVPLALLLRSWSRDVVLFTDGPHGLRTTARAKLGKAGIRVCASPIERLEGSKGLLKAVVLRNSERWPREALFFSNGHTLHCSLPVAMGCITGRAGEVVTDRKQRTGIPGFFVAGDASMDMHSVPVACAEGARAAVAMHSEMCAEDGFA